MQKSTKTRAGQVRAEPDHDTEQPAVMEALLALRRGDFSVRLPAGRSGTAGDINRVFNDVAELNERTSRELRRTSRIVGRHGQMDVRASIPEAVGGWARNVDAVNDLW